MTGIDGSKFQSITRSRIAAAFLHYRRVEVAGDEYPEFTRAAVLVPLLERNDGISVLLTLRTKEVETHKGQISLPGGVRDISDVDAIHTALRETEEELGIGRTNVEILGLLDDLATPTRFVITPVVGYLMKEPHIVPSETEVAEVIEVPLSFFADEKNGRWEMMERDRVTTRRRPDTNRDSGEQVKVWFFQRGEYLIWGATAMMLRNLIEILDC